MSDFLALQDPIVRDNLMPKGCDKNMPGCLMAAARHNRPTIIVYGGTIQPGTRHVDCPGMGFEKGGTVNISDAFESYGAFAVGKISDGERFDSASRLLRPSRRRHPSPRILGHRLHCLAHRCVGSRASGCLCTSSTPQHGAYSPSTK